MSSHPIEGTWLPTKAELSGESAPEMFLARTELTIRGGNYTVHFGGEISDAGSYAMGPGSPHATLTLSGLRGTNAGHTIPAIYQLVGDRLRICYGLDGALPTQFATETGIRFYLVFYRRKV